MREVASCCNVLFVAAAAMPLWFGGTESRDDAGASGLFEVWRYVIAKRSPLFRRAMRGMVSEWILPRIEFPDTRLSAEQPSLLRPKRIGTHGGGCGLERCPPRWGRRRGRWLLWAEADDFQCWMGWHDPEAMTVAG